LRCEELGLVLGEVADLDEMAEELAAFDELHQEVDPVIVLEHILHINQEWVVYLAQNIFLELDVLHLLVLEDDVLADALHRVQFASCGVLHQVHLAECALADHLTNLKVLKRCRRHVRTSIHCRCSTSHRLSDLG